MRAAIKLLALTFTLAVSLGGCVTNSIADQNASLQLRQQADAWDRAIIRKDREAIARNMAEGFRQIDSQGHLSDKSAFLTGITSDKLVIYPYEVEEVEIRFYGSTALITGTTKLHGTYNGKSFKTHYRYTDTYIRQAELWLVVHVQTTEITE